MKFRTDHEEIDFGEVWIGKKLTKQYSITNFHSDPLTFVITRSTSTNPVYYVFDFDKQEGVIKPGKKCVINITYHPSYPGEKHLDYLKIAHSTSVLTDLCLKGSCVGPMVHCSIKYYTFAQTANRNDRRMKFHMDNKSKAPAIFQFDDDNGSGNDAGSETFRVSPVRGTIPGCKGLVVTIEFVPPKEGMFVRQLCCLILHHKPLLLNLFGIADKKLHFENSNFRRYPVPVCDTVGFGGYMNDVCTLQKNPPPVSLSLNYVDFKKTQSNSICQIETVSVTNHFATDIDVEWQKHEPFEIAPKLLKIPAGKSALYELQFEPKESHQLYAVNAHGQVYWKSRGKGEDLTISIPLPINLRLIGHSFPNQAWIPRVSLIPSTILLPVSLPGYCVWSTFMIKLKGTLPVLFKLLPPYKTKFIMKPMVGLIYDYQIVVVQTQIDSKEMGLFVEKWSMEINGQIQQTFPIYVKAQVELPSILIGTNNVVEFEPISPYCQISTTSKIKNLSGYDVEYECEDNAEYGIIPKKWRLAANAQVNATWWFLPREEGYKRYETKLKLTGYNVDGYSYTVDFNVVIIGRCVYTELCSMPRSFDFGIVEYDSKLNTSFWLYNMGESTVFFKLSHNDPQTRYALITPKMGKCNVKQKNEIKVQVTAHKIGAQQVCITYQNQVRDMEEQSSAAMDALRGDPIEVFTVHYTCYYPALQITDLHDHNFGPLFSKTELWDFFKITEINEAFANLQENENAVIDLNAPEHYKCDEFLTAHFTIENIGLFDTSLVVKRKQNCNCQLKEITVGLTKRQKVFTCFHRDVFQMDISDSFLVKKTKHQLEFKIQYSIANETTLLYQMFLPHNRHILLRMTIVAITDAALSLSLYKNVIDLNYIYIGLKEAPIQAFWLYNNTQSSIPYKLDTDKLIKLNNENGFNVLTCLNSKGYLDAFSRAPLLFKFCPIEAKQYCIYTLLILGKKSIDIEIRGCGTDQIDKYNEPFSAIANQAITNGLIRLSKDSIVIPPLYVGHSSEQMFFIKNLSKTDVVRYEWTSMYLDGLMQVVFLNSQGELKAKESQPIYIRVYSLNEPCLIRSFITCEFYNLTEVQQYAEYLAVKMKQEENVGKSGELNKSTLTRRQPLRYYLSIPLRMSAVGVLDKDTCLSIEHQMTQKPSEEISINLKPLIKKYFKDKEIVDMAIAGRPLKPSIKDKLQESTSCIDNSLEINPKMTKNVLECIVADAVFSDYFQDRVKELKCERGPIYSQVKCPKNKTKVIDNFTKKLPLEEISELFDDLVIDGVQETFHLGPIMKNVEESDNK